MAPSPHMRLSWLMVATAVASVVLSILRRTNGPDQAPVILLGLLLPVPLLSLLAVEWAIPWVRGIRPGPSRYNLVDWGLAVAWALVGFCLFFFSISAPA